LFRRTLLLTAAAAALLSPISAQTVYAPERSSGVETVVVTASPIAKHIDDTAAIVSNVDRDAILASGGGNLADALANVPGVTGSGFAAGASRPIIRGMDSERVKLVENGLSSSDVSDVGPDHGVPIDPLSTQNIEVVRGAATLRYGSQAIGGVVNALNNRVPVALSDQTFSGEATAAYGYAANSGEASVLTDITTGQFAIHADGFYRNAGNYSTPLGTQANSFFVGNGFALGSSYFFDDKDHTGLALIQYDAKYGIPSDTTYILMRQTKLVSRSSFEIGAGPLGALSIDGAYANYSHEEKNPDGTVNTTFKNKEGNVRIEQLINAFGPFSSMAVGFEASNRDYSAVGVDSSYLSPAITNTFAGYVFADTPFGNRLNLETSARIENVHITGTPASNVKTDRDFTPISGAAGLLYTATDWLKLGVTASTAGRAPAQTELFARGGHDGPGTYETGDALLKIERANALEATARVKTERFSLDFSLWSSWFDNYIYGDLTGRTCDDNGVCASGGDGDLKELFYRQSGAHFRGAEGKARYRLLDTGDGVLSAEFQGDLVRATLTGGGNVPRIPSWRAGGGVLWESDAFDAEFQVMQTGKQTNYGAFDTPTPGFTDVTARLSWPLSKGWNLDLVGRNLADQVERNAASFNKDTVIAPGRDVRLVLRATL
jgi:iron complex outermembrane receptor protein